MLTNEMCADYQNRNPDRAICGHRVHPSSNTSARRDPSKFAIFIRDTPNFDYEPLLRSLLTKLHDRNVFPNFCYSVAELLKIRGNVIKMKEYGAKRLSRYSTNTAVACGCGLMMKDLIDHALKSDPQILIVDYISETLVEVRRILESVTQKHYKVHFLKRKPDVSSADTVMPIVEKICRIVLKQDLDKIRVDQEMDKWWNESIGIVVNHIPPVKYSHLTNHFATKQTNCLERKWRLRRKIEAVTSLTDITSKSAKTVPALCFHDQTEVYLDKMGDILTYCDFGHEYKQFMKEIRKDERYYRKWANNNRTLLVIKSELLEEKGGRRVIDAFVEELLEIGITVHVIPIAEILINPKCSGLMAEYNAKLGWSIAETFKTIVPDVFYQCYYLEDVVVLDCVRESIVGSEQYIKDALMRNWKVYIMNDNTSATSEETINNTLDILRKRHSIGRRDADSDMRFPISSLSPEKIEFL